MIMVDRELSPSLENTLNQMWQVPELPPVRPELYGPPRFVEAQAQEIQQFPGMSQGEPSPAGQQFLLDKAAEEI